MVEVEGVQLLTRPDCQFETMSATTNPSDSASILPLHNPSLAAQVVVPQAPIGNDGITNKAPRMVAKALLAKKLENRNPVFISPTDKLLTPCTRKLSAAKRKHFVKPSKPLQLPSQPENHESSEEGHASEQVEAPEMKVDDENPF